LWHCRYVLFSRERKEQKKYAENKKTKAKFYLCKILILFFFIAKNTKIQFYAKVRKAELTLTLKPSVERIEESGNDKFDQSRHWFA